jgi:hypothetical protein
VRLRVRNSDRHAAGHPSAVRVTLVAFRVDQCQLKTVTGHSRVIGGMFLLTRRRAAPILRLQAGCYALTSRFAPTSETKAQVRLSLFFGSHVLRTTHVVAPSTNRRNVELVRTSEISSPEDFDLDKIAHNL